MTVALALWAFLELSAAAPDTQPGTRVRLRLESPVSTRTARVGDPVHLRTANPIVTDGLTIPIGSPARGVVTRSIRPGRVRGRAELEIGIVSLTLPDGSVLPITASFSSVEPPRRSVPGPRGLSRPSPTLPILAGMAAGYGTAALVSRASDSQEIIIRSGVVAGLATGVLVGVLKRGEDLVLRPGLTIDVVFERKIPFASTTPPAEHEARQSRLRTRSQRLATLFRTGS